MSIAKEAQKSVSPAEWEMTCSRKPITCSVFFALAKKLLYLSKRDCGLASRDLAALRRWQFAVDLLARSLLQHVPPSRLSSPCGCCRCLPGLRRCGASPQDFSGARVSFLSPEETLFISSSWVADLILWSSREKRSRGPPGHSDRL